MLTPQEMAENIEKFRTNLKNLQIKNNLEKLDSNIGNLTLSGMPPDAQTIENLKKRIQGDKTFEPSPVPLYRKIEEKTYFTNVRNSIKNVFNSREQNQLNVLEANYVCQQMCDRNRRHIDTYSYDFHELKTINQHFFEKYYEGAGQIRDQDLKKDGVLFVPKHLIETVGQKIFSDAEMMIEDPTGYSARDFSERAGEYLGQLTRLQAFQEGNGRTNRTFISEMADLNGFSISWQNISQKEMKETSIMACKGDSSGLADLLYSNLLERDLEKMTDLMKGISGELTVKRVDLDKSTEYQGIIVAKGDYAYLQQQKENPHEIIFHENVNFEDHPIDFDHDGKAIYGELLGKEWLLDYKNETMSFEASKKSLAFGHKALEQDNTYDQKKESTKTSKHRDDYEEDYER